MQSPPAPPSSPRAELNAPATISPRVMRNKSKDMRIKELENELQAERKTKNEALEKLDSLLQVTKELKKKYESAQKQITTLQQAQSPPSHSWSSTSSSPGACCSSFESITTSCLLITNCA